MERNWKRTLIACLAVLVIVAAFVLGGRLIKNTQTPAPSEPSSSESESTSSSGSTPTEESLPPEASRDPNAEEIVGSDATDTPTQSAPGEIEKPAPVEPEEATVDDSTQLSCTFSITCETILDNMDQCAEEKKVLVPSDGVLLAETTVHFSQGESVFDVLQRVCRENRIHLEASWTPMYNSAYVEGIGNLYEFDVGKLSGWMFNVNGWFPNYGCSRYQLKDGDVVHWVYTCDLGHDVGDNSMG